jgi:hypothetical protein
MTTTNCNTNVMTDATILSSKGSQQKHYGRSLRVTIVALGFALASAFVTTQGAFAQSDPAVDRSPASSGDHGPAYGRRTPAPGFTFTGDHGPAYGRRTPAPGFMLTGYLSPTYGLKTSATPCCWAMPRVRF